MVTCLVARNCLTLRAACAGALSWCRIQVLDAHNSLLLRRIFAINGSVPLCKNAGLLSDRVVHIHVHIHDGPCLGGQRR